MSRLLLALLRLYKVAFSPFVGMHCRFYPTCSDYARDAIVAHGPWRGGALALGRLCRCHPFAAGGLDPVPSAPQNATASRRQTAAPD